QTQPSPKASLHSLLFLKKFNYTDPALYMRIYELLTNDNNYYSVKKNINNNQLIFIPARDDLGQHRFISSTSYKNICWIIPQLILDSRVISLSDIYPNCEPFFCN